MQLTLPWGGEVGWCQLSPRGVNAACLLKPRVLLGGRMRDAVLTRGADNVSSGSIYNGGVLAIRHYLVDFI